MDMNQLTLWGLEPKVIFDVCSKAIEFYLYQKKQEVAFHQHIIRQRESKLESLEKESSQKVENLESSVGRMEIKLQNLEREMELRIKAYKTLETEYEEKSRQCKQFEVTRLFVYR
jgi:E3 ubiquitin-protein ligase CCNP1IP1